MKRIRLEFPICWDESSKLYMPSHVYLKVVGGKTEAFLDQEFTQSLPQSERKISFEADVLEEIEAIEVVPPGGTTPVDDIALDWVWYSADPNWRVPGLKKVLIVLDGKMHEVPVSDEKPDYEELKAFTGTGGEGQWWFTMPWALAIYVTEAKTFGTLHWHSKLVEKL